MTVREPRGRQQPQRAKTQARKKPVLTVPRFLTSDGLRQEGTDQVRDQHQNNRLQHHA